MLKKLYIPLLLIFCCLSVAAIAQVTPDGILFQAVARDANGNAAAGRNVYAKVTLLKGSATGTSIYQESFKVVSTDDGIFTLVIGKGSRISGVTGLTTIIWNDALYFVNIKIAIEPSIPGPGWSAETEYVDMGTSQLWSVPYALFASTASVADSALSISTIVPGSKGGTGVDNGVKTISIAQNLFFKGVGDITISSTANSNVSLPATGLLANTQYVSDRIKTDTINLSNRINALGIATGNTSSLKVNISDTAIMLNPYLRKLDTASLSKRIDIKLDSAQIPGIIAPYLVTVAGVKYNDTALMMTPYRLSMIDKDNYKLSNNSIVAALVADSATLITRLSYKINASDTTLMLSRRFARDTVSLSNRINLLSASSGGDLSAEISRATTAENLKLNKSDTATILTPYRLSMIDKDLYKTTNNLAINNLSTKLSADSLTLVTKIKNDSIAQVVRLVTDSSLLRGFINTNTNDITTNTNQISNNAINISLNAANIAANASAINNRVTYSDVPGIVAPYLKLLDTVWISNRINLKAPINSPVFTGTLTMPSPFVLGATSVTTSASQLNYLNTASGTTGSGSLVYANSPIFSIPNLGTPSTGIATNLTGLPLTTGVIGILPIANGGTGSATQNFVDLTSVQTIAGNKSYSNDIIVGGTLNTTGITTLNDNLNVGGITNLTGNTTVGGNIDITGIATLTSQPIISTLTASKPVFTDANKGLTSVGTLAISQGGTGGITVNDAKTNLGLEHVDNTTDLLKPISTATLTALDAKEDISNKSTSVFFDGTSSTKYPTVKSVKDYVDGTVSTATPDATILVKGKVQLAGDLGGFAATPLVLTVGGSSASNINAATVLANTATDNATANSIVKRDANGNFYAGLITADLAGNATNVTGVVLGANGGTGFANNGKTITLGGNINTGSAFTTTGTAGTSNAAAITFKTTAATALTLPTTGKLATIDGTEAFTNKIINGLIPTSQANGFTVAGGTTSKTLTVADDAIVSGVNSGDQTITLTGDIIGSGINTFATTLTNSGATAGTYGSATQVPSVTVDGKGRITNVANITIAGVSSIGSVLESGKIIVGSSAGLAEKVTMSGDVTINNVGVTTIGANKIVGSKILNSTISYDKIQNVTATDKILGRVSVGAGAVEEINTIGTGNVVRAISPTFTGVPLVPTAIYPSNDGTIASTQYVTTAISNISASAVTGILPATNGGTGVNNGTNKITIGGDLTTIGAFPVVLRMSGATDLVVPTSGTLATLSDINGSTIGGAQITGVIKPSNGGTGIANADNKTMTLGGAVAIGGAFTTTGTIGASNAAAIILKTTAATDLTLPVSGMLSTLNGAEALTNKTISAGSNTISGLTNANLNGTAGITDVNLATISTSGKITNSATTATEANLANQIVARDANGDFAAGIISGTLNGNAATTTKFASTKSIYGNSFDGSVDLTQVIASNYGGTENAFTKFTGPTVIQKTFTLPDASATILTTNALVTSAQGGTGVATANANTVFAGPLSGSAAAPIFRVLTAADVPAGSGSYIANGTSQQASSNFNISGSGTIAGTLNAVIIKTPTGSSNEFLKADGSIDNTVYANAGVNSNITSLTGLSTTLSPAQGGTGVNNALKTITLGGDFVTSGNKLTLTSTASTTNVTLPVSGMLATLAGTEALTNKTINGLTPTTAATGFTIAGGTTSKILTVSNTADISGTNTGDVALAGENYLTIAGQTVTASAVNLAGSNVTGTLAAARFPVLTGDITNTAGALATTISTSAVTTAKIAEANVTLAKLQNLTTKKLIGNKALTTGAPGEIGIGAGLNLDETTGLLSATVSAGISSMNGLTGATQTFATGTVAGTGSDFNITSTGTSHTFNLPNASAAVRGVVSTGAQTFAGTKTLDAVNVGGALSGNTSSATIAGFNAAITNVSSAFTINGTNALTYNGKVIVCTSGPTITFDGASLPIGFTCMILQSDNTTVQFSGTVNRYNFSATSGLYSIATVICYASGSVLLTGDIQ